MNTEHEHTRISTEKVIDVIRNFRNELIKEFLIDESLDSHFFKQYNKRLSKVKIEFLKRDLRELLISPVDLVHYAALIKEIRQQNLVSLTNTSEIFFYAEFEKIFRKYNY